MIPISVPSARLLQKLKNQLLVDRSTKRVIIDINPEVEWVQLYQCEDGERVAGAAIDLIINIDGKHGHAPGSKKAKPASKPEASKPEANKPEDNKPERHPLKG